ncbi:MAG TPA: ATP-binding protein [Azospirillum sp.]|nr:ATP-binding protein [Azospirillum sp.]
MVFGAAQRRNGSPAILLLAAAGVVLSVVVFVLLRGASRDADRALLERQVVQLQQALEDRFDRQALLLHALRGLFAGGAMTRSDFAAAVTPMRPLFPELVAVGWVRHVVTRDVAMVERDARAQGYQDFVAHARGKDSGLPGGGDHFIVSYLEPRSGGEAETGLDLASLDGRRAVLEEACAAGRITATGALPAGEGGAHNVVLYMPVYGVFGEPNHPSVGCATAGGLLMAEFRVDRLAQEVFGARPVRGDVYLLDTAAPAGRRLLAGQPAPGAPMRGEAELAGLYRLVEGLEVGGRRWEVVLVPQPALLAPGEIGAYGLLVVGLMLTGLLTVYLRREARAKALLHTEARARAAMARMLRDSEERFRLALRHSRVSLFSQDRNLRYIWVYNPQVAIPADRFIGKTHADLFDARDATVLDALKGPVIETGVGARQEVRMTVAGRTLVADLVVEPLRDETGAVCGIICAEIDVTESTQIKEALADAHAEAERANQAKTRFLAAASHDLRQPFQAMSLFHHILMARLHEPKQLEVAAKLGEALSAGNALLNALLDTSALEAGNVKPRIGEVVVGDIVERLSTEMADQAAGKGLGFRTVGCAAIVRSDPVLLERMVRNLLVNALRYTQAGRILLGCRRRGAVLSIEVWDTGPGIPDDQLQRIFEDFYRCDANRNDNTGGLGLGLSIVRRTAQILNHRVTVRSRVGRGTVFAIAMPLVADGRVGEAPRAVSVRA